MVPRWPNRRALLVPSPLRFKKKDPSHPSPLRFKTKMWLLEVTSDLGIPVFWVPLAKIDLMYQSNRSFNISPRAYPGHLTSFPTREEGI